VGGGAGMPTSGEQYEKAKLYIKNKKKLKYQETAAILIAVKQVRVSVPARERPLPARVRVWVSPLVA
jgi:hypothetical protein